MWRRQSAAAPRSSTACRCAAGSINYRCEVQLRTLKFGFGPYASADMALITLLNSRNPLADAGTQRTILASMPVTRTFEAAVASAGHATLQASGIAVLQINVGKRCNQACRHCHV